MRLTGVFYCGILRTTTVNSKATIPVIRKLVPLIGLEIHAQLASETKLFSRAPYYFAAPPNTQLALLDVAIPGSLPVLNRVCVESAILLALVLKCRVNRVSSFDRKHYFYSDSPAGYQITQHFRPIAEAGQLEYSWQGTDSPLPVSQYNTPPYTRQAYDPRNQIYHVSCARIKRLQLEQDTGKSLRDSASSRTLIDLNRSGVGLVEIVTQPDFVNAHQVAAFLHELSDLLSFIGCCHANASKGELRVDVNVSVGPSFTEQGSRVEVKNINRVRGVIRAIEYEIGRQTEIVAGGGQVVGETRSLSETSGITLSMRDKEVTQDYRYLPEPNLPPLRLAQTCQSSDSSELCSLRVCIHCQMNKLDEIIRSNGDVPGALRSRLIFRDGLPIERVNLLVGNRVLARLYESTLESCLTNADVILKLELSYWICGLLFSLLNSEPAMRLPSPEQLSQFVHLSAAGQLYGPSAQEVFRSICKQDASPHSIASALNCLLIIDRHLIKTACSEIVQNNLELVNRYTKEGRMKKVIKLLLKKVFTDAKHSAANFSPYVTEQVFRELLMDSQKTVS